MRTVKRFFAAFPVVSWITEILLLLLILAAVTFSGNAKAIEPSNEQESRGVFKWGACQGKWGRMACGRKYLLDEPMRYQRDPLCRYIPWRCE